MRHSLALAVAAVTGMGISQVHGATANFIGGSVEGNRGLGTTSWTDPANWQDGYIPQEGDKVVMLSRRSGENDTDWVRAVLAGPTIIDSLEIVADVDIGGSTSTPLTLTSGRLNRLMTTGSFSIDVPIVLGSNSLWTHEGIVNQDSQIVVNRSLTGDVSLELRGNANWTGSNNWAAYSVATDNGTIALTGPGSTLTISRGAELSFSHTATMTDRLANDMPVHLDNGRLAFSGVSNTASTETIGDLRLSGRNYITTTRSGSGTAFLDAASLTRDNRATLVVRNADLGTQGGLRVASGIPMTDGMIAPWLVTSTSTATQAEISFAAYDETKGVISLPFTSRTQNDFSSAANDEIVYLIRDTSLNTDHPTLAGDMTVKALKVGKAMTIGGTGTLTISSGGLIARDGTQTINVPVAFGAEAVIYSTDNAGYTVLNLNGPVSGSNGMTIFGGAGVYLGSAANTFSGPVTVNHGTLTINGAAGLTDGVGLTRGEGIVLPVHLGTAGVLNLNGRNQRIGGLDGTGRMLSHNTNASSLIIVRDDARISRFSGNIAGASAPAASGLSLIKQGNGTQILAGSLNYGGTTTIDGGLLQIDGTLEAGSGEVIVNAGGTLGGNGVILRSVVSSGSIAPGASVGSLTVDSLSLESGSVLDWEVGDEGVDLLTVTGLLEINGPVTLNVSAAGTLGEGTYTLMTFGSLEGLLSDITFGSVPGGYAYDLQQGLDSINLVVMVPEPSALALVGLAVPVLLRRRRRS